ALPILLGPNGHEALDLMNCCIGGTLLAKRIPDSKNESASYDERLCRLSHLHFSFLLPLFSVFRDKLHLFHQQPHHWLVVVTTFSIWGAKQHAFDVTEACYITTRRVW